MKDSLEKEYKFVLQTIRKNKILKKICYPREDILKIMLFERKIKGNQRYYSLKFFLKCQYLHPLVLV